MKKILTIIALAFSVTTFAQYINITTGDVTYAFSASTVGDMTYTSGTTLTVEGQSFTLADIDAMYVDFTEIGTDEVQVAYSGTSATVRMAGKLRPLLTVTKQNAYVSIAQSTSVTDEITYTLTDRKSVV